MTTTNKCSEESVRIPLSLSDVPSHRLFSCPPPTELFHYTTLDGARGIIESKALRLTKVAYLNDRSELAFAIRLFRSAVQRPRQFGCEDHKTLLDDVAHQLGSFEQTNICVASFCEERDLLSQWRSYGNAGKGVALGFRGAVLGELSNRGWVQLLRCVYGRSEQSRIIEELIEILLRSYDIAVSVPAVTDRERIRKEIIGYFNTTFLRIAPVLKDPHFSEEREWRLVTVPRKTTDPKFQALVSNARVTQYYLHDFAPEGSGDYAFLESIVIGPTPEPELIGDATHVLCRRNNVQLCGLHYSQIPYRG